MSKLQNQQIKIPTTIIVPRVVWNVQDDTGVIRYDSSLWIVYRNSDGTWEAIPDSDKAARHHMASQNGLQTSAIDMERYYRQMENPKQLDGSKGE